MTSDGRLERVSPGVYRALPVQLSIEAQQVQAAIELYLYTGCRRSEITGLTWDSVDLVEELLHVIGKTGPRDVVITAPVREILDRLGQWREAITASETDYVLPGCRRGTHLDIDLHWTRIRARAGLQDVWLHDLRHTVASLQVQSGVPLLVVQRELGHASYQTTLRYSHMDEDPVRAAAGQHAERVRAILRGEVADVITLPVGGK